MNDATSNNNSLAPNALVNKLKADSFHARSFKDQKVEEPVVFDSPPPNVYRGKQIGNFYVLFDLFVVPP